MVYVAVVAFALLAQCLPSVLAHARVSSPPIRSPGPAHQSKCGQTSFDSVQGDPTGHIEEQEPVNAGCDLTLCRGLLFEDQPASNVLTVQPNQAMEMSIDCTIPHGGPANVSLIDTTVGGSGAFIGSFLKTFDDFCPTSGTTPPDQSRLQYNLPDANTIGNKCTNPGDCVVQLFWATPDFSQNYYYCHDVVMAAPPKVDPPPSSSSAAPPPPPSSPPPPPSSPPSASAPAPSKMVTSAASPPGSPSQQTAAAANAPASPSVKPNTSAGRRQARILWF